MTKIGFIAFIFALCVFELSCDQFRKLDAIGLPDDVKTTTTFRMRVTHLPDGCECFDGKMRKQHPKANCDAKFHGIDEAFLCGTLANVLHPSCKCVNGKLESDQPDINCYTPRIDAEMLCPENLPV